MKLRDLKNLVVFRKFQKGHIHIVLPLSSVFSKKKRVVVDASRALNPFLKHRRLRLQVGVFRLLFCHL